MKLKKWLVFPIAALMCLSVIGLAACGGGQEGEEGKKEPSGGETNQGTSLLPTEDIKFPSYDKDRSTNIAVHDPSVFYDEASKTYYAFGTHFAVASSSDLIYWTQEASDGEWTKLYGEDYGTSSTGWWSVLSQAHAHAGGTMTSTWAPDVNYYNGKYYMYVSVTREFGSSRSAISRVEADNVMGPYSNEVLIVTSDGSGSSNAIDPELFYDKDGGLWMVYGSTFGGIFIKELYNSGENWGLPKEDGVGKKVWAGGNNVEGPFVFYNEDSDYYYLMTSYGALMYSYNMRIARSKNPDGPYEDVTGQDMLNVNGNGSGGNKVAGSFKFANQVGQGWAALGHNSVVKDTKGHYLVVYHARRQGVYNGNTEDAAGVTQGHTLNVSQMYFNEEGWPVMSPVPYVGESAGLISQEAAAGEFDLIIHSQGITAQPVNSQKYTLAADGTVTKGGEEVGSWVVKKNYYVEIMLGTRVYKGVIVPGWDAYSKADDQTAVIGITAIADAETQGESLWAIRAK